MTEDFDHPTILFEETEGGFVLKFGGWEDVIEKGYDSFKGIRKTFQTSNEVVPGLIEEVENDNKEISEDYIRMENPPQQLIDDPEWQKYILDRLYNLLAQIGLYHIADEELQEQAKLLDQEQYKILLVRQSAFFEDFLVVLCQTRFQAFTDRVLSNKEMKLIDQMGHEDRTRLAYLLGAITEEEHGYLQQMVSARNKVAHNSWTEFSHDDEQQFETVSRKAHEMLENYLEEIERSSQVPTIDLSVLDSESESRDAE
ncbi:hypothetical protein [Salinigranum sp. GCM10025319]|uniref:hypothetical protein n=1 Tax=Salinigranum sp. GCM10025319 TaxID=3252687 RepID=UPI00360BA841